LSISGSTRSLGREYKRGLIVGKLAISACKSKDGPAHCRIGGNSTSGNMSVNELDALVDRVFDAHSLHQLLH